MWVARDKDGKIGMYDQKPRKQKDAWVADNFHESQLRGDWFPEVRWEDDEPHRVTLVEPEWVETYVMGYLRCCVAEIGEKLYATLKAEWTEKLNIASSTLWMMLDDRKEEK